MADTTKYQSAYAQYRQALGQATKFADSDLTNSAQTRRRAEGVRQARAALLSQVPAAPTTDPESGRAALLGSLAPTSADEVALQQFEWGKVQALLDAGRSLEQVILSASAQRLVAIANHIEVSPEALSSPDPEGVAAEVRDLVVGRLAEAGHEAAAAVLSAEREAATEAAWHRVLSEAIEGPVTLGALTDLHNADPEGFAAVAAADVDLSEANRVDDAVARLDALERQARVQG